MTSITVRNLDESIKAGLRLRAARHGWSMEQEVRLILRQALSEDADAPFLHRMTSHLHAGNGLNLRPLAAAARVGVRAAGVEGAAAGRVQGVGHFA